MNNQIEEFNSELKKRIYAQGENHTLKRAGQNFMKESILSKYSYNFSWLGVPIIQYPQDIVAMQELVWEVKPDLIIETGIAHGGSLIFYASIMELIGNGDILGIDIDLRDHNREVITKHLMYKRIQLIEGSSIDTIIVAKVKEICSNKTKIMVLLDSNHTYEHVIKELELYSQFVSVGSYLVVFDTIIEDLPEESFPERPWSKGNNPKTAVKEFLISNDNFIVDNNVENKLLITVAPNGYLKRVK